MPPIIKIPISSSSAGMQVLKIRKAMMMIQKKMETRRSL